MECWSSFMLIAIVIYKYINLYALDFLYLGWYIPILYRTYVSVISVIILIGFLLCLQQFPLAAVSLIIGLWAVQSFSLSSPLWTFPRNYPWSLSEVIGIGSGRNENNTKIYPGLLWTKYRAPGRSASHFSDYNSKQQPGVSIGQSTLCPQILRSQMPRLSYLMRSLSIPGRNAGTFFMLFTA